MQLSSALQQKCQKEETMERNCRCLSIKHSERVVNVLADHWAALSPTDRLWDFGSASPHKALTSHVAQPSARGALICMCSVSQGFQICTLQQLIIVKHSKLCVDFRDIYQWFHHLTIC